MRGFLFLKLRELHILRKKNEQGEPMVPPEPPSFGRLVTQETPLRRGFFLYALIQC